jgi:hypothetical protein
VLLEETNMLEQDLEMDQQKKLEFFGVVFYFLGSLGYLDLHQNERIHLEEKHSR